jgi:ribulose-5-phosphate 4-epimerase/fuculose-1-phosphate aldolase
MEGGSSGLGTELAVEFHAEIYRQRPDVKSVVHTHSPWVTVLASTDQIIKMYNDVACVFGGEQAFFDQPDPTISPIDGKLMAAALGAKSTLLLRNHGVVFAAQSLEEATMLAIDFEEMVKVHIEATRIGGAVKPQSMIEINHAGLRQYRVPEMWAANIRRLRRTDPDLFDFVLDAELRAHGYVVGTYGPI